MKMISNFVLVLLLLLQAGEVAAQKHAAPKPVFDDPVYHGAADPVIIFNKKAKQWWMFYTNRRASINDSTVQWVHGTRIGIAVSKDGAHWTYKDTADINYRPDNGYTFWAPDITEHNGLYHMFLTYVPGTFTGWEHPRTIIHCTSKNLIKWKYESTLPLVNEKVIDPSIYKVRDSLWRLWYNNEKDGKTIWYAESKDLYHWVDKGKAIATRGEGPKVFYWQHQYFMIVDAWKGMEIFSSDDLLHWKKQATRILEEPGTGKDDQAIGGHCDVVVNDGKAYVYYFTHPGRYKGNTYDKNDFELKRSVIQVAELKLENGIVTCNRNETVTIQLNDK